MTPDSASPAKHATSRPLWKLAALGLTLALVAVLALPGFGTSPVASADHKPADKVAAAGSTLEVLRAQAGPGGFSDTVSLLSGSMRTSSPTDLIIEVTAECALFTDIKTIGNDESRSRAQVTVWVEFDGKPVPVAAGDDGMVTFCNRDFKMITSKFEENENATIELYQHTRNANGFNWVLLNAGSGEHTIEVKASLDVLVEGKGDAMALVGKRTLVVQPVKLANDVSI